MKKPGNVFCHANLQDVSMIIALASIETLEDYWWSSDEVGSRLRYNYKWKCSPQKVSPTPCQLDYQIKNGQSNMADVHPPNSQQETLVSLTGVLLVIFAVNYSHRPSWTCIILHKFQFITVKVLALKFKSLLFCWFCYIYRFYVFEL